MLPRVLAGPIVRRVEPGAACVWIATREPEPVRVEVCTPDASGERLGAARARSVRLGPGLSVHLATVVADRGSFPTDTLLGYDVVVGDDDLDSLGLLDEPASIAYPGLALPTFWISSGGPLRLLHGSCRLLHGAGEDALVSADELLAGSRHDLAGRPSALILTGDQIYGDEVASPLIHHLTDLAAQLMGPGDKTSVPGMPSLDTIDVLARGDLVTRRAGFTSGSAGNHLMSLGEYAAMYVTAWNERAWPARWPPPPPGLTRRDVTRYRRDGVALEETRAALPTVRRVLANLPVYMAFDDHDVTDDWNITREWHDDVYGSASGRRIVANALAAFWAFQGWGNDPSAYEDAFVDTVGAAARRTDEAGGQQLEQLLWDADRWSFVAPTEPPAVVIDTRTQRRFDSERGAARLVGDGELARIRRLARRAGVGDRAPALLVSAVPVFGLELHERRQKYLVKRIGPYAIDFEQWHSNLQGLLDLMRVLIDDLGVTRMVVLSGDVHYGLNIHASFAIEERELAVAQLISSAIKHSGHASRVALRLLGRVVSRGRVRAGWDGPPELTGAARWAQRILHRPVNTDAWDESSPVFLAAALARWVDPDRVPCYREARWYVTPDETRGSPVVAANNIGLVTVDDHAITHRLLGRLHGSARPRTVTIELSR